MRRWSVLALLGCVACSQVLGLDEAQQREAPAAGGVGGTLSSGGSSGAGAGGIAGSAGAAAGSAGMNSGGNLNGGAAGAAAAGGVGAGGNAGTGAAGTGAAGAGAAGAGATAGAAGSGGTTDTCTFAPLGAPWVKISFNGSFETWTGTLPVSWNNGDNHPPNGSYEKVAGCHGANALRLSDLALGGAIQGARGFFTPPSVGATSCWTLRGYGRLVSGSLLGAGATLYVGTGAYETQALAITSSWESGTNEFTLSESLGTSPFVQVSITADTLDETTAADFDNLELWYHDGPCAN